MNQMTQLECAHPLDKYLRQPYVNLFCPGCGESQVVFALLRAIDELALDRDKVVIVCGVGCHNIIRTIVDFDVASVLHGRALPFATGLKLTRPELTVIVFTGDGDGGTIGGNHLIHAARRNTDVTHLLLNNFVYANTGGQLAATTPTGARTTTSVNGNVERPFDLCSLVTSAGASYVARWTTHPTKRLVNSIKEGIRNPGYSYIETLCACPTLYAKHNAMGSAGDEMKLLNECSMTKAAAEKLSKEELKDRFVLGKFVHEQPTKLAEAV
ncbi:MAG: 2-oxoacid:ferredoxin oxidoreductase subunit beta [Betaproteobacteria bacterium]|nr:2-oxoacid:ferredoxin oxidoreductase subunit beta [Betaproteobacteria bacterium]